MAALVAGDRTARVGAKPAAIAHNVNVRTLRGLGLAQHPADYLAALLAGHAVRKHVAGNDLLHGSAVAPVGGLVRFVRDVPFARVIGRLGGCEDPFVPALAADLRLGQNSRAAKALNAVVQTGFAFVGTDFFVDRPSNPKTSFATNSHRGDASRAFPADILASTRMSCARRCGRNEKGSGR